jgi:GH15 family glucan-1,4-alpha-glucosidase
MTTTAARATADERATANKRETLMVSPFTPIADYAFLSDCHTGALIAPDGSVDWLCVPSFDSPSIFGSIVDREAGNFRFGPYGIVHPVDRGYVPGTNVVETTWRTRTGWMVVRDALTLGPAPAEDKVTPHTRPPADVDADHLLVRTVACISGSVEVELVCEPLFDYGRTPAVWSVKDGERHVADASGAGQTVRLCTDIAIGVEGNRLRGRHVLTEGQRAFCVLSWADQLAAPCDVPDAEARISSTIVYWRTWLANSRMPDHRWRESLQRSALTIKGLTYMPTGATVAALTTSLPETPGGARNWDYRYTWMRDSTFTLRALHYLLLDWEADDFMQFVADIEPTEGGSLQIMYGIDGRRDLTRRRVTNYPGTKEPIRCVSATARSTRSRMTSSVRSLTRSCSIPVTAIACRSGCGRSWSRRPNARRRSGRSPTRASGRRAERRSTTCPRS